MATLGEIEQLTKEYADAREERVDMLQRLIDRIKRRRLAGIKTAADRCSEAYDRLYAALEESPELFRKPKSLTLFGIKVGFQKQKGDLVIKEPDHTVKLIRKHFSDTFDTLVKTTYRPLKGPLNQLAGADLRKLGIELTEDTDAVLIKSANSEVEKWVDALLKESDNAEEKVPA